MATTTTGTQLEAEERSADNYGYTELDGGEAECTALAQECAIALSYNGLSQAVMMVTPSSLEDFVTGFSIGNGLVGSVEQIYDIQVSCTDTATGTALHAAVEISSRAFASLKQQRRNMAGTSGCGLCGVEALAQALPSLQPLPGSDPPSMLQLQGLRSRVAAAQELARESGALHAALYLDGQGTVLACREDIGRHNALDKLIGAVHRQRLSQSGAFAVVTSRCSLELIQKAVRGRIATLVCLSAPTRLSVEWARTYRLNLLHVPRRSAPRLYSPAPEATRPDCPLAD